ncbi:MAG: TIGR03943 family putative permease subunit [Actinomycetota bacterium]
MSVADHRAISTSGEAPPRSWSMGRLAAAVALGAWAGLFWFLLLSGRTYLYLSTRTAWVVPVGAILLSIAALGRLATARTPRLDPITRRAAWGLGVALLPVVTVLALPPAALGSFAASRRSVSTGFAGAGGELADGPVTFAAVAAAGWSPEVRRGLVERAGSRVTFEGIVTRREGQAADEFILTRFVVSCCVADALSVQVRVVGAPPGKFEQDQWVRVSGTFYPIGREMVVAASDIQAIPRPERPYVNV